MTLTASTVDGGTFTNIVEAKSAGGPGTLINGGTFTATSTVTTNSVAIIKNGTFNGSVYNSGTVDGGSFQSYVYNSGTVSNGAFDSNVTNETGGSITGGTFRGGVTNNGTLFGGDFKETVNSFGSISGGSYSNDVYNESDASITGGTFNRYIYNSGTITGGTLLGIVENKGSGSVTPGDSLSYGVTYRLKGITSSNTATLTASNRDYQTTLSSTNGNALPLAIRVTMNGVTATPGTDYTWDDTTGALTIMKATELAKMGPITISAGNGYLFFVSYTGPNDGTFKGSSYYQYCDNGESFDVASPMIAGYAPDKTEIKGTIEGENLSATVTYSPITYTVAFDANGGTGAAMAPMSFTYGQAQNLSTCTFSRTGYTFAGWATTTGTTTANYTDGQSVGNLTSTAGAQKTLYAVWTPRTNIQYHVRYFKAGLDGSFGVNPDETVNGFGTAGQQTAAAEKTYEGFTVRPFRQTTIAGDGSTFVDIYYDRDVHSVSVVYVGPSDGTFSAPAQHAEDVVYGATYSVESPTVTGYAPDVATVAGTMGTSDVSTTVTYSPITYTVAFNANGGTGSMTPMTLTYDTSANLTDNEFTAPTGYHFAGWAISTADAAAGTVAYADGASVGNLATAQDTVVTLYAVWTEDDNITISYVSADALMGTVTPGSESLAPATGKAKGAVATPNPGYRFVSWTTQAELRPNSADDQATDSLATQSALTTQSTLATQSAGSSSTAGSAGSSAGGSAGGSAGTSNSASTPIVLGPNPSAIVVSTDPTLTGAVVDAVTKASGAYITTTFTANFAPVTYTVAFNTNGGSGSMDPMTLTYGTADTLTANTFTREGHTFTGWNTKPDGTGTSYADGQSVSNLATTQDDTVTLYAQWTFMGSPTPTKPATTTALPGTGDASASTASGLIAMTIAGGMLLLLGLGMFVARRRRA